MAARADRSLSAKAGPKVYKLLIKPFFYDTRDLDGPVSRGHCWGKIGESPYRERENHPAVATGALQRPVNFRPAPVTGVSLPHLKANPDCPTLSA